ncbi:Metallo-peptidase family M12B Reprolysin-like-domain-containing protein [Chytridium lagenaria]|nr:Metallo-peptidase family M12B Reprolysin-like-domain-containing protein [Chytridium lagenaria]
MLVDRISHYAFRPTPDARLGRRSDDDGRRILSFKGFNRTFEFDIYPNDNLVASGASIEIDGNTLSSEETRSFFSSHVAYHGHVAGDPQHGWARFVMRHHGPLGDVKTVDNYKKAKRDIASPLSRHPFSLQLSILPNFATSSISSCSASYSPHSSSIPPKLPPATPKVYLKHSTSMFSSFFSTENTTDPYASLSRRGCCTVFNVALAIVKVKIETTCNNATSTGTIAAGTLIPWNRECVSDYTINERLSDFSNWRGNYPGAGADNAGLWHLMTGCSSTTSGQAVGVAWLKTTCTRDSKQQRAQLSTGETVTEYVSGTGVSSRVPSEWKVVAHEVGHNFGANHDCDATTCGCQGLDACLCCRCPSGRNGCDCEGSFLMHPTDNAKTSSFSDCSITSICTTLSDNSRSNCLSDTANLPTVTENICGNGVREANEECDCGDAESCRADPCCDGTVCKLKAPAVCDDLNDNCCLNCQLRPKDSVCRPSIGVCDYAETCSGTNKTCPADTFHPDKEGCGNGLACASGQCTSRTQQCQNRIANVNTTGVCAGRDSECKLFCSTSDGLCTILSGNFLDGTPCGFSGTCISGGCSNENIVGAALDWFKANPPNRLANRKSLLYSSSNSCIPQVAVLGLIVISIFVCLVRCCMRGCSTRPKPRPQNLPVAYPAAPATAVVSPGSGAMLGTYQETRRGSGVASVPSSRGGQGGQRSNWVDPAKYNGY